MSVNFEGQALLDPLPSFPYRDYRCFPVYCHLGVTHQVTQRSFLGLE